MLKAITAKKRLGQNFLTNKNKIKEIVSALDIKKSDTIIEIGPGQGELTTEMVKALPKRIIAVEKDELLAEKLGSLIKIHKAGVEIISGDVLRVLPNITLNCGDYKLVGNIPYYITGFLLRIIGELKNKPKVIVLTVQKEVALRISAEPPKMNLLAASVQFWTNVKIIGFIPKNDFFPEPKVDSAIIKLETRNKRLEIEETKREVEDYYNLIKIIFRQPRKTVLNNLLSAMKNRDDVGRLMKETGITIETRPQNLSILQIKDLASKLAFKIAKNR